VDSAELIVNKKVPNIVQLTLNRPHQLNAWTLPLEAALFAALDDAMSDPVARVVVITGAGSGFCAGASMDMLGGAARPAAQVRRRRLCELAEFPKPIIAAVNGAAAGLGFALALWCDVRICANDAKLTAAFSRLGLVAEHGTAWLLPRLVGRARATDLLLSGRVLTGTEAFELGLATRAVERDQTLPEAMAYAQLLVDSGAPSSWRTIKGQVNASDLSTMEEAYQVSLELMEHALASADHREGVQAWMEKRPPRFAAYPEG